MTRPKRELEHGTRHGYAHYKCRCQPCVDANADYSAQLRAGLHAEAFCPLCCEWVQGIVRHEQRAHARQTA